MTMGCSDCDVELDSSQIIDPQPTKCFKCGKDLVEL